MRPVVRGPWPKDEDGNDINYKDYATARAELISRLGECCSYCEMRLNTALAVEHVQPKNPKGVSSPIRERELDWNNFLLACTNCNSTKGAKDVELTEYFWPDRDNTFRAFRYSEGGIIRPSESLPESKKKMAQKTIELTGLNKHPSHDPKASDRRWLNRGETWNIAQESKNDLQENDTPQMRRQIIRTAMGQGYWSIWMTVFEDDPEMKKRLIDAISGTAKECFSEGNYSPTHRLGGQI